MKIWNLTASHGADGSKILDVQIHGVIDGGWLDDSSTSTAEIAKALAEHPDARKINVQINSVGGSLFGGVALYNILNAHGAEVTSTVVGLAASAASLIAMAGKTVMGRGAMMMIHNPLALAYGDASDLRRTAAVLDKARDSLLAIYKAKTGKDGAALKAMLDAETWLGAEQAKRQGFANEIADGGEADAPLVEDRGEQVLFNSLAFPRASLPAQILAMAAPRPPVNPPPQGGQNAPQEDTKMTLNREILAKEHPELLAALLAEGEKAGEKTGADKERARVKAIFAAEVVGHRDLIAKAIDDGWTAEALEAAAYRAEKQVGTGVLEARRNESKVAAGVHQSTPEAAQTEEQRAIENMKRIAQQINASRKGGK